MRVTLLNYTQNAKELLIFTKSTRLKMSPDLMNDINLMSEEDKLSELHYMSNTIPSSWEFVDYTFLIEDVSRAFTHQLVRSRQGSYAQQTMRVLNKSGFDYVTGPSMKGDVKREELYEATMDGIDGIYKLLIKYGAEIEDARGILPTNICTNIVAKYNLRTLSEIMAARASARTQAEYRCVLNAIYDEVIKVHPWADMFLRDKKYEAAAALESRIKSDYDGTDICAPLLKQLDILRKK